jgi:hypothetical protein
MKRKILRVLCVISGILVVVLIGRLLWIVCHIGPEASVIGGAGLPTLLFLLTSTSAFFWLLGAIVVFVISRILLGKSKK